MARVTRRGFLQGSIAGGVACALRGRQTCAAPYSRPVGANGDIRVAMIGLGQLGGPGVGARGHQLIDHVRQIPNVRIVALCDVDQQILDRETQRLAGWNMPVKKYTDLREAFDASDIDAVFVATPNHWHALATVWACQAGKDVYVEKPASHSLWEGRQMVAAARTHKRIVQVGTQGRSSDVTRQAVEYLRSGKLGAIRYAQAIVYRRRESIGKATAPQDIPPSVRYNLWLGPAQESLPVRRVFHYDWHWFWDTGNGEIGNNGVHYLDRCRLLLGATGIPARARSIGGRFLFDDNGQTPNTQIALLEYEPAPIICEVRGLASKPDSKTMDRVRNIEKGIIVQCEGGSYRHDGKTGAIFDNEGKQVTSFAERGADRSQDFGHQQNFVDAVRSRDSSMLHAEILEGHHSAALCHLANVSYRLGKPSGNRKLRVGGQDNAAWSNACERFYEHLEANRVDWGRAGVTLGPVVTLDRAAEQFVGEHAERANQLSRRAYRKPFVVPELA